MLCPPHAPSCSTTALVCWLVVSASVRLARRLLLSCNLLLIRSQSPTQLRLHGAITMDQNGACRLQRPSGTQGTQQSALGAAGVDTGTSRRRGANGGRTTTTSTSVGIAKCGTSAMAGHHAAGKHAAAECRRTWGRRHLRPRLGSWKGLLWLPSACQCQVACFEHRANGSGMHSGMRAAHRPVEQHRPGTDHAGQHRGGAPSAGAPVTSPARQRRRDPRDGPI